jgi:hypothetical protein
MYYSKKIREQKLKELKSNKEFIEYAQNKYEMYKRVSNLDGYNTFEEYLVAEVCGLYENFTVLELLRKANAKTINNAIDIAVS